MWQKNNQPNLSLEAILTNLNSPWGKSHEIYIEISFPELEKILTETYSFKKIQAKYYQLNEKVDLTFNSDQESLNEVKSLVLKNLRVFQFSEDIKSIMSSYHLKKKSENYMSFIDQTDTHEISRLDIRKIDRNVLKFFIFSNKDLKIAKVNLGQTDEKFLIKKIELVTYEGQSALRELISMEYEGGIPHAIHKEISLSLFDRRLAGQKYLRQLAENIEFKAVMFDSGKARAHFATKNPI